MPKGVTLFIQNQKHSQMKIFRTGNHVVYERDSGLLSYVDLSNIDFHETHEGKVNIVIKSETGATYSKVVDPTAVEDHLGLNPYTTADEVVHGVLHGYDVNVQDQSTPTIIAPFTNEILETTLSSGITLGDRIIPLSSVVGAAVGDVLTIYNSTARRLTIAEIIAVGASDVTIDRPIDYSYPIASNVSVGKRNLAVNGSVTPVIFGVRNGGPSPVGVTADITRIIVVCQTSSAVDLNKFGNLAALTNGLYLRRTGSVEQSIICAKTNAELVLLGHDWIPYQASNPSQGVDGFSFKMTFSGQENIGVVQRLLPNEDLEFVVQDNLSTITSLYAEAEGHVVTEY